MLFEQIITLLNTFAIDAVESNTKYDLDEMIFRMYDKNKKRFMPWTDAEKKDKSEKENNLSKEMKLTLKDHDEIYMEKFTAID